jgi:hypothetical protein
VGGGAWLMRVATLEALLRKIDFPGDIILRFSEGGSFVVCVLRLVVLEVLLRYTGLGIVGGLC